MVGDYSGMSLFTTLQQHHRYSSISLLLQNSITSITSSVKKALPQPKSKKRSRGRQTHPDMSTIKEDLMIELNGRDSIPRGVMSDTLALLKEQYEDENSITRARVETKIKNPTPVARFKTFVESEFDAIWDNAVEEQEEREEAAARKKAELSAGQKGKAKDGNIGQVEIDEEEESEHEPKDLRTCTTTLKRIARPDMSDMSDNLSEFISIAKNRQREVTGALREVAALAQKTTLLVSDGDVRGSYHSITYSTWCTHVSFFSNWYVGRQWRSLWTRTRC